MDFMVNHIIGPLLVNNRAYCFQISSINSFYKGIIIVNEQSDHQTQQPLYVAQENITINIFTYIMQYRNKFIFHKKYILQQLRFYKVIPQFKRYYILYIYDYICILSFPKVQQYNKDHEIAQIYKFQKISLQIQECIQILYTRINISVNSQFELNKKKSLGISVENGKNYYRWILCVLQMIKNLENFINSSQFRTEQIQYPLISDGSFINIKREEFNAQFNTFISRQLQIILINTFKILIQQETPKTVSSNNIIQNQSQLIQVQDFNQEQKKEIKCNYYKMLILILLIKANITIISNNMKIIFYILIIQEKYRKSKKRITSSLKPIIRSIKQLLQKKIQKLKLTLLIHKQKKVSEQYQQAKCEMIVCQFIKNSLKDITNSMLFLNQTQYNSLLCGHKSILAISSHNINDIKIYQKISEQPQINNLDIKHLSNHYWTDFAIVTVICFLQIKAFQQYIKAELLESVIQKSIISNIQLLVGEGMHLTYVIYSQYSNEIVLFYKLYHFQSSNKIVMDGHLEDCRNAVQLQSFQQCYNGSSINTSAIYQFKQFIQFQNQILPYRQDPQQFLGYYNVFIGDQLSYSIQVQERKPKFDKNLINIHFQLISLNNTIAINQVQSGKDQLVYVFYAIPQSKTAMGILSYQELLPIQNELLQTLKARTYIVLESGLVLTDSKLAYQGQYFQNVSGFTNLQFEMIKNYSLGLKVKNQCEKQVEGKTLCLIDAQNNQKLIFTFLYKTEYDQFLINILDANFVLQIREDFNQQFNTFVNMQIKMISIVLVVILVLCLITQALLIINLSRPLQQLVEIAQYNFNHNQYKFQTLIRNKNRSQIQQLQDSYFDLINLSNQRNYERVKEYYNNPSIQNIGLIHKVEQKREAATLKAIIKKYMK
ncbi:hypothetical protein pb186bvf_016251 [Paramecium bursaria]